MGSRPLRMSFAGGCGVATADDSSEALAIPTRQGRLVLARLALAPGPVARDELADLLWPDALPPSWERHLSAVVSKLGRLLGSAPLGARAAIAGRPGCYELRLPPGSVIDVLEAEAGVQRARMLLADDRLDEALGTASGAAAVARRPFLPGTDALWVDERREALRVVLLQALEVAVEVAVRRSDPDGVALAREAIAVDPYREAGYRHLMRLLLAMGEPAAAAEVSDRCRAVLEGELGLAPSAELEELRQSALDGSAAQEGPPGPPSRLGFRQEGSRLPVATTSFVGREDAVAAVAGAFRRSRLVTLTGTGGVGKSRLALETVHLLAGEHRDGACLCELAHVADSGGVAFALAAAVGVRQLQGATIEDSLVAALAARELLVVVDNCEHVLDEVVPLLERILHQCPRVHVLATSRERLAADGETVVEVPPLELPDEKADPMTAWDQPAAALELLRDRIVAVRPGFRPDARHRGAITEIARRLDGLPLALELAATRIAAMGPLEVAGRLDRRFTLLTRGRRTALARHRTLRAAIEWSYDLLDERERRAFERATVFVGGFTLDAAEHVCAAGGGVRREDVADVVTALVDKSMLIVDDRGPTTRYRMLETLRQFGHERLAALGELPPTERAHALHYTELAWQAEPHLRGPGEVEWVSALDAELGNLGAAHVWALRSGNRGVAAQLSAALLWFAYWRMRTDVLAWADQLADDEPTDAGPHLARAVAAAGAGAWMRGELARARTLGDRAIAVAGAGTATRYGWHPVLGPVALFEGRLDDSCAAFRRAAELARHDGDHYHAANALGTLAVVQSYAGDASAAIANAEASRVEAACSGSPTALAWNAYALGEVLSATEPDDALPHLDRAVELSDTVAAHFIHGVALLSATSLRARHGDSATAAQALIDIIDHWERAGNWRQQWTTLRYAVELFARLGNDKAAATVLGAIDASDAANLFGADAERLSVLRADLVARLGTAADEHVAEGRAMNPADVVAFTRRQLAE